MKALSICVEDPISGAAQQIVREYLDEVASRFHGRTLSTDELDAAVAEFPNDDLASPAGLFWMARLDGWPVGCVGLRMLSEPVGVGEVTRLFVRREVRRQRIAQRLMAELENESRHRGLTRLRLDTRDDLIEARHLYSAIGFDEVPAFNSAPYAEHWFERTLP